MSEDDYTTIKIPKDLAEKMDKLVGHYGFTSRAEIAKEGIRRLITALNETQRG